MGKTNVIGADDKLYGISRDEMNYRSILSCNNDKFLNNRTKTVRENRKRAAIRAGIRSTQIIDVLLEMDDTAFDTLMLICQRKDERYSFLVDGIRLRDEHIRTMLFQVDDISEHPRELKNYFKGQAAAYNDILNDGLFEEFVRRTVDMQCTIR